ncbi:hypothetical protein Cst_c10820 [Thermoclostridium stercorarium subsp. stercorarium DSM 8532]|uniref:Uncharacterized protein n=1 Tax=Thermoclostridium stercorarium (strain ATCC 35414 / DSM 8532 / NCIMB 11754) TaxID=1121335 RepID=L7VJ26_THES1|nr:hypothetical protein Cst_c10820 [Thermoclostridium stercorarium subsp. stercorarium DSM 8532]
MVVNYLFHFTVAFNFTTNQNKNITKQNKNIIDKNQSH